MSQRSGGKSRGQAAGPDLAFGPHVLREYSMIADGRRAAVVGPRGDITWMCFPEIDSPSIFDTLLGGQAAYTVHPVEPFVWGGYYEDANLIFRDRWVTTSGSIVECREALAFPGEPRRAIVLRRLKAIRGGALMRADLGPQADYGQRSFRSWRREEGGCWTAAAGGSRVRWSGSALSSAQPSGRAGGVRVEFELQPGEETDLVLEITEGPLPRQLPQPDECWRATESSWRQAMPSHADTRAPRDARLAYAVLVGLTRPGGGTAAAATCALPERADEGRNYDYRFAWIRDQSLIGCADAVAGESFDLLDASVSFVCERVLEHGPDLAPAYTTSGLAVPGEMSLQYPGYPGGRAVIGNHAAEQLQLDAFGESLGLLAQASRLDRLDQKGWQAAELLVDSIARRWREPDAGIWELENRQWTHSRLSCVAGLRAVAETGAPAALVGPWTALADEILADTARGCVHPSGRWQRAPDDERVDAALLLPPLDGALPADDPRTVNTYKAVERDLSSDGYLYRYRPDERPLGDAEGAFQLCVFSMALAAKQQGDMLGATRWFERGRAACGPAGLFTEEFDVEQRQLRGNLPQAFVHAMFLRAAAVLG